MSEQTSPQAQAVTSSPFPAGKSRAMERDEEILDRMQASFLAGGEAAMVEGPPETHRWPEGWHERLDPHGLFNDTESPIEHHLQRALFYGRFLERDGVPPVLLSRDTQPLEGLDRVQIIPQLRIGVYRADFAIVHGRHGVFARVVVECDGRDFHDRTQEQANHDRLRDRRLMAAGWPVLRFAGSEIASNVLSCASEIGAALSGLQWDMVTAYRAGLAALHRQEMEARRG